MVQVLRLYSNFSLYSFQMLVLQMSATKNSNLASLGDIEDLVHNFLIIMLEYSMRQKDGWKVDCYLYFT